MEPPSEKNKISISRIIFWFLVVNLFLLDAAFFWRMFRNWQVAQQHPVTPVSVVTIPNEESSDFKELESTPSTMIHKDPLVDQKIATVVAMLTPVKMRTAPIPTTSQILSTTYVSLGGGNITTSVREWSYLGSAEAYFNKASYPGAKSFYFEVFLKIDGSGEVNARLYDATTKVLIKESELTTNSGEYVLVSSSALPLFSGNNLYQVQIRSSNGYPVSMQGARLRVEY